MALIARFLFEPALCPFRGLHVRLGGLDDQPEKPPDAGLGFGLLALGDPCAHSPARDRGAYAGYLPVGPAGQVSPGAATGRARAAAATSSGRHVTAGREPCGSTDIARNRAAWVDSPT